MWDRQKKLCLATAFVIVSSMLSFPSPAVADGGPVLSDPELWAQLEEGQQTAVVTLKSDNTVDVDLFVSLLDNSGQSHEVVFFVPLGTDPGDFNVTEKTSLDFDEELVQALDEALRKEAENKANVWLSLLPAVLLTNGAWMLALCFPLLLSGCGWGGGGPLSPEETFETDSSRVDIYGLDDDTDLEALINTTELDQSVRETLARLTGQRIAVVTLQTQPPLPSDDDDDWYQPTGQPGIHLAWTSALVAQSAGIAYSYPLGTGSSWARPIGLTRIYVVAPPGLDFTVQYPRLGTDHSGYSHSSVRLLIPFGGLLRPRIMRYYSTSAYAVDEATGDFGRVWRATYTQSNSAEDVVVSLGSPDGFLIKVRRSLQEWGMAPVILLGLLIALLLWVTAWRYCMPRILGMQYRWRDSKLWHDSLEYLGINAAATVCLTLFGGVFLLAYLTGSFVGAAGSVAAQVLLVLLILAALFGLPGIWVFITRQRRENGVSGGQAAWAYIAVVLAANSAYLALAFGYAALAGAL